MSTYYQPKIVELVITLETFGKITIFLKHFCDLKITLIKVERMVGKKWFIYHFTYPPVMAKLKQLQYIKMIIVALELLL